MSRTPSDDATGKAKGGFARAAVLSKAKRKDIAQRAALARWQGPMKKAVHGSSDRPLRLGGIAIPCYVLEDETRVLSQRGLHTGIGLSEGGGKSGARKIAELMAQLQEKGINSRDLAARANSPIRFVMPGGGIADGYDAKILPDICAVLIEAGQKGKLGARRAHLAERAAILQHGFATLGIIALVDEATGYQEHRRTDSLARILEEFIAKELQPYVTTFQVDYYKEIYRLRGLEYPKDTPKRPQYFGVLTNDIVYKRLAPGVLEELKRVTPRLLSGRHKDKLFQRLTQNKGYPKLREHLGAVVTMMQLSNGWHDFMAKLDRLRPRLDVKSLTKGQQLSFDYDIAKDSGRGL
jgi:P63C domain